MERACWSLAGVDIRGKLYAFTFKYLCGPFSALRRLSQSIECFFIYLAVVFHQVEVEMLLSMAYDTITIALKNSAIWRPYSGWRVFAVRPVGEGSILEYYYCSRVHDGLSSGCLHLRTYGKSIKEMTKKTILN